MYATFRSFTHIHSSSCLRALFHFFQPIAFPPGSSLRPGAEEDPLLAVVVLGHPLVLVVVDGYGLEAVVLGLVGGAHRGLGEGGQLVIAEVVDQARADRVAKDVDGRAEPGTETHKFGEIHSSYNN